MIAAKKILIFIQNGVGGAERMTINIAKLLMQYHFDVTMCKVSIPCIIQNGRIEDFIPNNLPIINVSWSSNLSLIRQFYQVIKNVRPDIIFSSVMPYNQRLLFLSPLFRKIKFIVRNDNYLFTVSRIKRLAIKFNYKNADIIIAQTKEMKDELVGLSLKPSKIIVLNNIFDEKLILDKSNEPSPFPLTPATRFVSVGRVATQKGFDILIRAFAIVRKQLPDAELYIIGDNTGVHKKEYERLKEIILKLGLDDYIVFTGYTDNPYIYIKNANAFVLSSRYEGLPNVLIEAQFLGTPSAAVKCIPMIERMIKDGENGYLAETENPQSLADAMINALNIDNVKEIYKPSAKKDFIDIFK